MPKKGLNMKKTNNSILQSIVRVTAGDGSTGRGVIAGDKVFTSGLTLGALPMEICGLEDHPLFEVERRDGKKGTLMIHTATLHGLMVLSQASPCCSMEEGQTESGTQVLSFEGQHEKQGIRLARPFFPGGVNRGDISGFFLDEAGTLIRAVFTVSRYSPVIRFSFAHELKAVPGTPLFTADGHLLGLYGTRFTDDSIKNPCFGIAVYQSCPGFLLDQLEWAATTVRATNSQTIN